MDTFMQATTSHGSREDQFHSSAQDTSHTHEQKLEASLYKCHGCQKIFNSVLNHRRHLACGGCHQTEQNQYIEQPFPNILPSPATAPGPDLHFDAANHESHQSTHPLTVPYSLYPNNNSNFLARSMPVTEHNRVQQSNSDVKSNSVLQSDSIVQYDPNWRPRPILESNPVAESNTVVESKEVLGYTAIPGFEEVLESNYTSESNRYLNYNIATESYPQLESNGIEGSKTFPNDNIKEIDNLPISRHEEMPFQSPRTSCLNQYFSIRDQANFAETSDLSYVVNSAEEANNDLRDGTLLNQNLQEKHPNIQKNSHILTNLPPHINTAVSQTTTNSDASTYYDFGDEANFSYVGITPELEEKNKTLADCRAELYKNEEPQSISPTYTDPKPSNTGNIDNSPAINNYAISNQSDIPIPSDGTQSPTVIHNDAVTTDGVNTCPEPDSVPRQDYVDQLIAQIKYLEKYTCQLQYELNKLQPKDSDSHCQKCGPQNAPIESSNTNPPNVTPATDSVRSEDIQNIDISKTAPPLVNLKEVEKSDERENISIKSGNSSPISVTPKRKSSRKRVPTLDPVLAMASISKSTRSKASIVESPLDAINRIYKCTICNLSFRRECHLNRHVLLHSP